MKPHPSATCPVSASSPVPGSDKPTDAVVAREIFDRWDRAVATRDPEERAAMITVASWDPKQYVTILDACVRHRAWDWLEPLWPPTPAVMSNHALVRGWILDVMAAGEVDRALTWYQRAQPLQGLGTLLFSAVQRGAQELWETLVHHPQWEPAQGQQAALGLVQWVDQNPDRNEVAKAWFQRLTRALPDAHHRAAMVATVLTTPGLDDWATPLFQELPQENRHQLALEVYPKLVGSGLTDWQDRCWEVLEALPASPPLRALTPDFFRAWIRTTPSAAPLRLMPCLADGEAYTLWHAARAEKREDLAQALGDRLAACQLMPHRFHAVTSALEDGDLRWCDHWWSPAVAAEAAPERMFGLAVRGFGHADPAAKAWAYARLDWDKLSTMVAARQRRTTNKPSPHAPFEDFEEATLDDALVQAPAAVCAEWVQRHHRQGLRLPLAAARALALQRRDQASTIPVPNSSPHRRPRA